MTTPKNSSRPWMAWEDERLVALYSYSATLSDIARRLGRTEFAIECRLRQLEGRPPPSTTDTKKQTEKLTEQTEPKKETEMKLFKVEKVTKVNGYEVQTLSDDTLICYIRDLEQQVSDLEKVKVASEAIHAKIDELKQNAKDIAAILDARSSDSATV